MCVFTYFLCLTSGWFPCSFLLFPASCYSCGECFKLYIEMAKVSVVVVVARVVLVVVDVTQGPTEYGTTKIWSNKECSSAKK